MPLAVQITIAALSGISALFDLVAKASGLIKKKTEKHKCQLEEHHHERQKKEK